MLDTLGPIQRGGHAVRQLCRIFTLALAVLYLLALALFLIGAFGLFGSEQDPLAGVFLIPLGFPWNRMLDAFPEATWPWLAAAAPAVNLLMLSLICRFLRRRL